MYTELKGKSGKIVGSEDYFRALNHKHMKNLMPNNSRRHLYYDLYRDIERNVTAKKYQAVVFGLQVTKKNSKTTLKKLFEPVAAEIAKDLSHAPKGSYIKDENAKRLNTALNHLKQCNISYMDGAIKKGIALNWYMDVDAKKVKELQRLLNELGYGYIEVTGIYDAKTDKAWMKFVKDVETGDFVKLCNQTVSGIDVVIDYAGKLKIEMSKIDISSNPAAKNLIDGINRSSKIMKIGKRVVVVAGPVLTALEVGMSIEVDLKNADIKFGKKTYAKVAEIGGEFLGIQLGYAIGEKVGVSVGTAVASATTGVIAGAAIGIVASLVLGALLGALAGYIIDASDFA